MEIGANWREGWRSVSAYTTVTDFIRTTTSELTVTTDPTRSPAPEHARQAGPEPPGTSRRLSLRTAGIGLTSLGAPAGIGIAHPLFGEVIAAIEVTVILTIIGTALFGSHALSERAFRLLRWIGNRPEPPEPAPDSAMNRPATFP